jgi:hypothetical protein
MLKGNAHSLAQWFMMPADCNRPQDDEVREKVLNEVYSFQAYAVNGDSVLLKTPNGRVMCTSKTVKGCPIVEFDWVPTGMWVRQSFWMNKSSVNDLGTKLRASPEKRRSFDELFVNE